MPGGAPENEVMKGAFETEADHIHDSMADAWKHDTISGPDNSIQEGSTTYYGFCETCPGAGWLGPNRSAREQAQSDVDAHNQSHPGHGAAVYTS